MYLSRCARFFISLGIPVVLGIFFGLSLTIAFSSRNASLMASSISVGWFFSFESKRFFKSFPMVSPPSTDVGEVVLTSEQSEKSEGENASQRLIGAVFGTRVADLTENLNKMGKIVLHSKPP